MLHAASKPRLRGVSHRVAFLVAPFLGLALVVVASAHGARALIACSIYAVTLVALFGVSAGYHRSRARPEIIARWRRADHSTIFLMIAGTYTPLCLLGVGGHTGWQMLALIWGGAALGVMRATLWTYAPRSVSAVLYVAMGWFLAAYLGVIRASVGDVLLGGIVLGGVLYTVGALIYAVRRPNPAPATFGYHEIFHQLDIAAALCHYAVVVPHARAA
jgi:hemolysin III